MEFYHILFYSSENTSAFSLPFRLSLNPSINIFARSLSFYHSLSIHLLFACIFLSHAFLPVLWYLSFFTSLFLFAFSLLSLLSSHGTLFQMSNASFSTQFQFHCCCNLFTLSTAFRYFQLLFYLPFTPPSANFTNTFPFKHHCNSYFSNKTLLSNAFHAPLTSTAPLDVFQQIIPIYLSKSLLIVIKFFSNLFLTVE